MKIANIDNLHTFVGQRYIDIKSLIDGGMVVQWSYTTNVFTKEDLRIASCTYQDRDYIVERTPTKKEYDDMIFGWLVESGITSNSVIYVKDEVTVGIGTGEQDRVGVARIARDKAYTKYAEKRSWQRFGTPFSALEDENKKNSIREETEEAKGGLRGSAMVSDAFFPFRDGVDVGLREGVTSIIQPGGSLRDFESIEACNESGATMVFTGQRSFKH
jgi:phosphoribosylaminoimidazolecarboxamide formyltransferase/IMP cyclohydrolase